MIMHEPFTRKHVSELTKDDLKGSYSSKAVLRTIPQCRKDYKGKGLNGGRAVRLVTPASYKRTEDSSLGIPMGHTRGPWATWLHTFNHRTV